MPDYSGIMGYVRELVARQSLSHLHVCIHVCTCLLFKDNKVKYDKQILKYIKMTSSIKSKQKKREFRVLRLGT